MTTTNLFPEPRPVLEATMIDNDRLRRANGRLTEVIAGQKQEVERLQEEIRRRERSERELRAARDRLEVLTNELEEVSAELLRSRQEFGYLAKAASHDLRAPMRTMGQFVQLLMERLSTDIEPKQKEYLEHILDGSERMSALMCDLLTFSRVVTTQPRFQPVDCHHVLELVVNDLKVDLAKVNGTVGADGELPAITGDPALIEQLFQNIITNALRFRSTWPPKIVVAAEREGEEAWTVAFADNGIGIDPRYHDRIFRIFQRLHTRDEYPGTGMGLAIAKRIMEHHRGRIDVQSSLGQGATFRATFPDEARWATSISMPPA